MVSLLHLTRDNHNYELVIVNRVACVSLNQTCYITFSWDDRQILYSFALNARLISQSQFNLVFDTLRCFVFMYYPFQYYRTWSGSSSPCLDLGAGRNNKFPKNGVARSKDSSP